MSFYKTFQKTKASCGHRNTLQLPKRNIQRILRTFLYYLPVAIVCQFIILIFMNLNIEDDAHIEPIFRQLSFDYEVNHWNTSFQFIMPEIKAERKNWHDYVGIREALMRTGPGEQGQAVFNTFKTKKELENRLTVENGFNAFISDMISVNRSVPDVRLVGCLNKLYFKNLPSVSLVISCRNEYVSVLKRTLHSIVNRTPKELLKEIIIVDDNSSRGYSIKEMELYAYKHFPNLVKFIPLKKRMGLMYVRVTGAKAAKGDVIVFFDSHIECNYNWLPPLLEPIAFNDHIVTTPFIDTINATTFEYIPTTGRRGGFRWDLFYIIRNFHHSPGIDETLPYKDAVMMGGLFAISRRFFFELGGYDLGLDTWGLEQFDLSFKIWMCGGMLLTLPCSHVAHIFTVPKDNKQSPTDSYFLERNKKRVAEVWMDNYKNYVYAHNPEFYDKLDAGNLTEQHAIRKRLSCKSFDWYLQFVAGDFKVEHPIELPPDFASGAIQSVAYPDYCLDTHSSYDKIHIFYCAKDLKHPQLRQYFNFNFRQQIKNYVQPVCLDVIELKPDAEVILYECHDYKGNQFWFHDSARKLLIHGNNGTDCMELKELDDGFRVVMNFCNESNSQMQWNFGFVNKSMIPMKFYL